MKIPRISKIDRPNVEHNTARAVRCPVCHRGRLLDAGYGTDISQMQLSGSEQSGRCQWYIKCPKCGRRIGINFTGISKRSVSASLLH